LNFKSAANPVDRIAVDRVLAILREGEAELRGLFRIGSNETYLCELSSPKGILRSVYKPVAGERPLWDFPVGTLSKREAAAFEVSRALGWNFVPPTVFRWNGPLGPGSFQEYLELDFSRNYFFLRKEDPDILRRVAVFDAIINNADRKAMHLAKDSIGAVWLIDHGICFHQEWKLRTVVWDFAGEEIPEEIRSAVDRLRQSLAENQSGLRTALGPLLLAEELTALESRIAEILTTRRFPKPGSGISVPWPIMA
jgi:hypothetical protein